MQNRKAITSWSKPQILPIWTPATTLSRENTYLPLLTSTPKSWNLLKKLKNLPKINPLWAALYRTNSKKTSNKLKNSRKENNKTTKKQQHTKKKITKSLNQALMKKNSKESKKSPHKFITNLRASKHWKRKTFETIKKALQIQKSMKT